MRNDQSQSDVLEALMRAQLAISARSLFTARELLDKIAPTSKGGTNIVKAYNLCDGTRTQAAVVKQLKLDPGNFSKLVNRWIESGLLFKIPNAKDKHLLHLFPIAVETLQEREKEKNGK